MFLTSLLKNFIKVGTLELINHKGKKYEFAATPLPKVTIRLHSKHIERRLCYNISLALGEGYMSGDLTVEGNDIRELLSFLSQNYYASENINIFSFYYKISAFFRFLERQNTLWLSKNNVSHHYDIRKELYDLFLDDDFQYSCAYFSSVRDDLETAQENKKRHIAAKLRLKPGQKVLDIGSGWGGLALYLGREAGVEVTGLTLSEEQLKVATERAKEAGLSNTVKFYLRDYREEQGCYDRIVSVGMFEHVGTKNFPTYFNQIHNLLKPDGIALLHSIGNSRGGGVPDAWLKKYIFPGGYCPALSETIQAIEPAKLTITDIEILHHHYAETLRHWRDRFMANYDKAKDIMGERFCRMWEYYLACSEAAFRDNYFMVFQIQMVKDPNVAVLTRDYIGEWEKEHPLKESHKAKAIAS